MSHQLAAFHSQCQWTRIFLSLTTPMAMGTRLGFKRHRESHYSCQCSQKLWFRHYYQWIFLQVALPLWVQEVHINSITGITIHITESKIQKSWFDTHVVHWTIMTTLSKQYNTIIQLHWSYIIFTCHLLFISTSRITEFHTNVRRLRLFLRIITCTYDLANGTAQNNRM